MRGLSFVVSQQQQQQQHQQQRGFVCQMSNYSTNHHYLTVLDCSAQWSQTRVLRAWSVHLRTSAWKHASWIGHVKLIVCFDALHAKQSNSLSKYGAQRGSTLHMSHVLSAVWCMLSMDEVP
eukprot:3693004-Amphidinium_carterae.1